MRLFKNNSFIVYITLIAVQLLLFIQPAYARWKTPEEADTKIEFNTKITVNQDGTSTETVEIIAEILKEKGRNIWANYPLTYNANCEKITILEAKTILNGIEYPLAANLIEDKPLASNPYGFDQNNQVSLAYRNAEINSKLYLKYRLDRKETSLKNYYYANFHFGSGEFVSKAQVILKSAIPLYSSVNDPSNILEIKTNSNPRKSRQFTELHINLKKPIYRDVTDEQGYLYISPKNYTSVHVTNIATWDELVQKVAPAFNKVISQKLPQSFEEILNKAKEQSTDIDKINTVTSLLADKIQYMGDWRTVEGKFEPHDLANIASTQLGDCKDYTAALAAILHNMGYRVQPTLVMRGIGAYLPPTTLPLLNHFNHVFLRVILSNGDVLWVDPTNITSMANGIFDDIANKPTLILDSKLKQTKLSMSPISGSPQGRIINATKEINFQNNKSSIQGNLSFFNEAAIQFAGWQLLASDDYIKEKLFSFVGDPFIDAEKFVEIPNLQSRIVKDVNFKYKYEQEHIGVMINLGEAIALDNSFVDNFTNIKSDSISDVIVGPPTKIVYKLAIKNYEVKNAKNLAAKINSKWLDIERDIHTEPTYVVITNKLFIKKFIIPNKDLKTKEFQKLKHFLIKNFRSVAVIGATILPGS